MTSTGWAGRAARAFDDPADTRAPFYDDPIGWVDRYVRFPVGQSVAPYQREILGAIPTHGRVTARGCHGIGKTTISSLALLWFATTRELSGVDWKCVSTAGSWRQLSKYLWPEVHKWARRLDWDALGVRPWDPRTELMALTLSLRHGSAFAVRSDDPALIEGTHADAVLFIYDEAKSIIPAVFDASEGAMTGPEAYALALSTPGEPSGRFFDLHRRAPGLEEWHRRHVTVDEAVAAGRVTRDWVNKRRVQWGPDSAVYQNRVLGQFATSDEAGIVPLAWIEAAVERWNEWDAAGRPEVDGKRTVGVDVARSGSDRTVLAVVDGLTVVELRRSSLEDTMQTTGRVKGVLDADPARTAVVDVIGVGGGVVDRLREQRLKVEAFNSSESSSLKDRSKELGFINTRAAAWWHLRELLDPAYGSMVALPPADVLIGDLTAPRWKVTSTGRIQVEGKDEIRKRIGRSTDDGDAVVMGLWGSSDPVGRPSLRFMTIDADRSGRFTW